MKITRDNKLLLKILSALAAIGLWFAITYTEDPLITQYLTDIDIVFEGENTLLSNGLIVTNKDSLPSISVSIRGNRSSVISAINNTTAQIDVSKITSAGTNTVEVKYNYPTSSVVLHKAKTREISIETEKVVSREIPVKVSLLNEDKNTAYTIKPTQNDSTVKIRGAASAVYAVSYAKATVDVTDIATTHSQEYFYKLYDDKDNILPEDDIIYKSKQTINIQNEVFDKKTFPVKVVLDEAMQDDNILLVKNQSVTNITAGVTKDSAITEIYAYFDKTKKSEDGVYELMLNVPDGCYIPEDKQKITATCELIPKVLKELEIPVVIENAPEGKTVKITPEKIKVSLKGAEDKISESAIKAKVDAKDVGEHFSSLEVVFETKENIDVVGSYTVTATAE